MHTSNSDYDIIILIETWLNSNLSSNEFFDPKLFQVFSKGRDFGRMQCERGGVVIVAVSRKFCGTVIRLLNADSLLDQLAVTVSGSSGKIPIVASYVPPGSDSGMTLMAYVWQETSTLALFSGRGTHKHLLWCPEMCNMK